MEPKEYKEHREQLIRKSYALIREYEDIIQTSSDPKEKARARRVIEEQWNHIWEYLESYIPLCIHLKRRVPDDIRQLPVPTDVAQLIVARYAEHDLASLYVKGLLSSLDLKQFRSLCLDLLEEKGYHIEDDDKKAATILATRESRLTGKEMWAIRFVHSPDRDPDAWVRRREIAFRELKRLSGQLDVVGYLFITSSQFSTDLHEYFRSGLQGKEVQYWDGPIIKALLLDYPYLWQKYVSPYQLTERSPLLSAYYELVDDELLAQQPSVSAKAFYGGNRPGWGEIAADLDARRIVYSGDTVLSYEQLLETLRSGSAERFILLTAEAGGGKTTLLFRIGYDLYQLNKLSEEDTHMVLRLRYGASPHAHPLIELHQQTRKPLYVLMDIHDTEIQIKGLDGMLSELHAQKVPATVIAAARANEWGQARGWQKVRRSGIPSSTTLELGKLSLQEIEAILDLLQKHNQLPPLDSQVRKQLRDDFFIRLADRQLFVALMEITHDKKRFEHILLDEYENLPRIARRAYRYVCVLHAYGILLPRDFLVSVLKLNRPADLWDDVLLPTEGVIVEDTERTGYVRTRHHRIAEALKNRLADNVLKDIQSLKEMAASIIEAARYYIGVERYVVLKLLLGLVQDSMYPPETRKEFVKGLSNTYSDEIANMLYRAKVEGRYIELAEWGRLYYELDELEMDKKCLEDALHIAPVDESARLNYYYGRVLRSLESPAARRYFEFAYHPDMETVEFLHSFAQLEIELGHFEQAAILLEKALVVDPGNKTCRKTYTILLDRFKTDEQYDRVVSICKAGLQANPDNVQTRWSLATALRALGQNEEAVDQLKAIIWLEPDHEAALQYCASTLIVLGPPHYKEAADLYERLKEIHSTRDVLWAQLRNNYALLLAQMGKDYYPQAEGLWEEITEEWPGFSWAHLEFGRFLFRHKQQYRRSLSLICEAVTVAERTDTSHLLPRICSRAREVLEEIKKEVGKAQWERTLEELGPTGQLLARLISQEKA